MKRTIEYWTGHEFLTHWTANMFRLAEHEVALSFTNDAGAAAFIEWWDDDGKKAFESYCETIQHDEEMHP